MEEDFSNKIFQLQQQYYESSGKNVFFKKEQKFECASLVCDQLGLDQMINQTFYYIPKTNKIYIDYTMFKIYANPSNFDNISNKLLDLLKCLSQLGEYEVHVNLDSFTISACERYKQIISLYCEKCLMHSTQLSRLIKKMYIYNCPSMIETMARILKPIIHPDIHNKMVYYNKTESPFLLLQLLTIKP